MATAAAVASLMLSGQSLALGAIRAYRHLAAPLVAHIGIECRFAPSCSHYGELVIARDGLVAGGWKALSRVARCGPWTESGTIDEP
jgi:putative membrane protein insertion efficiency factor